MDEFGHQRSLHDSGKYSNDISADDYLRGTVKVIKTPVRAPKANAFCEIFIGTFKREFLNHFTCFSPAQLNYICKTWFLYYNTERPHRGKDIGNNVLDVDFIPTTQGRVRCKQELGGIIKSYYREAA